MYSISILLFLDTVMTKIEKNLVDKRSLIVAFHETKERLLRATAPLLGRLKSNHDASSRDYSIAIHKQAVISKGLFPYGVLENQRREALSLENTNQHSDPTTHNTSNDEDDNEEEPSGATELTRRQRADKNEGKRRQQGLLNKITSFLETPTSTLAEALGMLDEAVVECPVVSTYENHYSEDLNIALGELLKVSNACSSHFASDMSKLSMWICVFGNV